MAELEARISIDPTGEDCNDWRPTQLRSIPNSTPTLQSDVSGLLSGCDLLTRGPIAHVFMFYKGVVCKTFRRARSQKFGQIMRVPLCERPPFGDAPGEAK